MVKNDRLLRVFLSHASEDKPIARQLCAMMRAEGWIDPWLDEEKLLPGHIWRNEIESAEKDTDVVMVLLSNRSVSKEGYIQREIKLAIDIAKEKLSDTIFIVPIRLDNCKVPTELIELHYVEFDDEQFYEKVLKSLQIRARYVGVKVIDKLSEKSPKKRVQLILDEDINNFTCKYRLEIRIKLSKLLHIEHQSIQIINIEKGSVKILVEMPENALRELANMMIAKGPLLYDQLKLLEIKLENKPTINLINQKDSLPRKNASNYSPHIPAEYVGTFKREVDVSEYSGIFPRPSAYQRILFPAEYVRTFGRESELQVFRRLLQKSPRKSHIILILGDSGIGKTKLVRRMLDEARDFGVLATEEPIDFFSTDLRYIDGIQWKIKEILEQHPAIREQNLNPFRDFIEGETDTNERFYECLKNYCALYPSVIAFDTFENLDTVTSDWLFRGAPDGLQVPGLLCIVAGRPEKANLDKYRTNAIVEEIILPGLTLEEAKEYYRIISAEMGQEDLLENFLLAAGINQDDSLQDGIEWLWQITNGNPLKLEMAFRWTGTLFSGNSLLRMTAETFEEKLMEGVREMGARGLLDVGRLKVSQPVYDTLVCMAYVTRRFDEGFLRYLIDRKLIRLNDSRVRVQDVLDHLERYFFVKVREGSGGRPVFQLHDEMARLVREYVWPYLDPSGEKKMELLTIIDQYYDQLIEQHSIDTEILWVEKLYYALQRDFNGDGRRLWFELVDLDNHNINKFLTGEIKNYIRFFDDETKFEIYIELGRMERTAHHINQAMGYYTEAKKLAEETLEPVRLVKAWSGLASCYDPKRALKQYKKIKIICEQKVPERIPDVYYDIGFTYRRMNNIRMAITWYRKATDQFRAYPRTRGLQAKIANDLGYMYSIVGEWENAKKTIDEGLRLRKEILAELDYELKKRESETSGRKNNVNSVANSINLTEARKKTALYLGLSYSTLGEVYRYQNELEDSLRSYKDAYELFLEVGNEDWQARTLYSMGETNRRLAEDKELDKSRRQNYIDNALQNIEQSLYLCEKYQLETVDTANRRMGRLYHDLAIYELSKGERAKAQEYLDKAKSYFEMGLILAKKSDDVLEELELLAELAFIVDDFIILAGPKNRSKRHYKALDDFKKALDKHRKDKFRIYQFPVFENLYKLEEGTVHYRDGNYKKALDAYLEANVGLATNPGYGQARYQQHFDHLTSQIVNLDPAEAEKWCKAFIQAWETTPAPGKKGRTLAQEMLPDLVTWCRRRLKEITSE
jgi:tetratricopeptide (TPR) repeat protein